MGVTGRVFSPGRIAGRPGLQTKNEELKPRFRGLGKALTENEEEIVQEQIAGQGKPVDMGGYFHPDLAKVSNAMRPIAPLNSYIDQF